MVRNLVSTTHHLSNSGLAPSMTDMVVSVPLATNPHGKNLQGPLFIYGTFCLLTADSIHLHSELRSDNFVLAVRVAF